MTRTPRVPYLGQEIGPDDPRFPGYKIHNLLGSRDHKSVCDVGLVPSTQNICSLPGSVRGIQGNVTASCHLSYKMVFLVRSVVWWTEFNLCIEVYIHFIRAKTSKL